MIFDVALRLVVITQAIFHRFVHAAVQRANRRASDVDRAFFLLGGVLRGTAHFLVQLVFFFAEEAGDVALLFHLPAIRAALASGVGAARDRGDLLTVRITERTRILGELREDFACARLVVGKF